jgi:two-component system, OmpR family, response regulator QseB
VTMAAMQAITSGPTPAEARLLLVEDEPELRMMLEVLLTEEGYLVDGAADGQRALHLGLTRRYDVIVLDRMLPGIDGLDVVGRWRRSGRAAPVLVLSALGTPRERVAGLDAGAEDYLSKPFDVDELLARLRALRRRHLDTARELPVGDGLLDLDAREFRPALSGGEQPVPLSERECELLAALAARPGRVFSREDLLLTVFTEAESPIVVDTYVHYLRRKLGRDVVRTIRGRGYRLGHEARR